MNAGTQGHVCWNLPAKKRPWGHSKPSQPARFSRQSPPWGRDGPASADRTRYPAWFGSSACSGARLPTRDLISGWTAALTAMRCPATWSITTIRC